MTNWFTRAFGAKVKTAANDDIMSVAFPDKGQTLITDSRTAIDKSVWVYRAAATVATRIGSLPWHIYKGDKVVEGNDFWLKRPSPMMTGTEFVERIILWMVLNGTGMVYVEKPAAKGITVLDADCVHVDRGGNIQYRENGSDRALLKENIVLFPNLSLTGQLGLSELRPILDSANMDENGKQVWNNQMSAGGALSGLFTSDTRLTGPEMEAAKKSWEEKYAGIQKAGGIGWLSAGYHFEKLGISAADLRLLEVSHVSREEIGAAFGVPGIFMNDTQSVDYSNAKTQEKVLYTNVVKPKADRLADRITTFLLPLLPGMKGLTFKFDYTGIECLKADALLQAQTDEIELRMGKITINEICKRDNVKEKAWGDVWWGSAMLTPISTSDLPEPEPAPAPVLPSEPVPVPVDEGKAITKGISTETRRIIAKSFLSTVKPQERKFASNTMKVFGKQSKDVVAWVEEHEKAAPVKKLRDVLTDDDFVESWHSLFVAFGKQALEDVAARYDMIVPDGSSILKWIRAQESKHSKLVNDTTADEISKILADCRANGESIADMTAKTRQYFDNISYRAERVARTNVIACNNASAQDVYVENGVKEHEWLATNDDRTRDDHADADGQVRDINEPFDVGGEKLMYPGDSAGSAENTIQCRCTELPVI